MTMVDHEEKIDLNGIYTFTNSGGIVPFKVIVKYYDGKIVACVDCRDLKSVMILTLDMFMDFEPLMVDRL